MRHLTKPNFNVKTIVEECASSFQSAEKRKRFNDSSDYIQRKSAECSFIDSKENTIWIVIS